MTLSNRIAVMDRGVIRQTGTPTDVYEYPQSRFVAGFIGSINMLEATVARSDGERLHLDCPALGLVVEARADRPRSPGEAVTLAVRPEKFAISRERPEDAANILAGTVLDLGYFGKDSIYRVRLDSGTVLSVNSVNARRAGAHARVAQWEDRVHLAFEPGAVILLSE